MNSFISIVFHCYLLHFGQTLADWKDSTSRSPSTSKTDANDLKKNTDTIDTLHTKSHSLKQNHANFISNGTSKVPKSKAIDRITSHKDIRSTTTDVVGFGPVQPEGVFMRQINISSLLQICIAFNFTGDKCSCNNSYISFILRSIGIVKSKEFCQLNGTIPTPETFELVYDANLSRAFAATATLIVTIALIGNSMVILVNVKKRKLSRYESLITLLSVCDITFALIHLVIVTPTFWTNKWVYNEASCKILPSLMTLGSLYGIGITMIIAIERYIGVVYPVQYTKEKAVIAMSIINVVFGLASVMPLAWHLRIDEHNESCSDVWQSVTGQKIYIIYLLVACTAIPIISVTVLYSLLICNLRSALRDNKCHIKSDSAEYHKRVKQNIRITNVLLATTFVYALVITPYRAVKYYLISNADSISKDMTLYFTLSFAALLPYPLHLAANPVIYSIIDSKWRSDFKMLLRGFGNKLGFKSSKINKFMHNMTTFRTQQTNMTLD